jgi:hypothetical protein
MVARSGLHSSGVRRLQKRQPARTGRRSPGACGLIPGGPAPRYIRRAIVRSEPYATFEGAAVGLTNAHSI